MEAQLTYLTPHLPALDVRMEVRTEEPSLLLFSVSNGSSPTKQFALTYFAVDHLPPLRYFSNQHCFYIIQLTRLVNIDGSVVNTVRSDSFINTFVDLISGTQDNLLCL